MDLPTVIHMTVSNGGLVDLLTVTRKIVLNVNGGLVELPTLTQRTVLNGGLVDLPTVICTTVFDGGFLDLLTVTQRTSLKWRVGGPANSNSKDRLE